MFTREERADSTASAIWASLSFREAYTDGTKRGTFRLAATVTVLSAPNESPLLDIFCLMMA